MSLFLQVAVVAVVASVVAVSVEVEVVVADGDSRPKEGSQNPESWDVMQKGTSSKSEKNYLYRKLSKTWIHAMVWLCRS